MNNYLELKAEGLVRIIKLNETEYHLVSDRFDPMKGTRITNDSTERISTEQVDESREGILRRITLLQAEVADRDALLVDMDKATIVA